MSRLLKQTILNNDREKMEKIKSDNCFFDSFIIKKENIDFKNINIKIRSSPYYKHKCLNKVHEEPKFKGKIIFPIIETILVDKGQVNHWLFTDETAGYVLKRNSDKLKKDKLLKYFVKVARDTITETQEESKRNLDRIIEDIHRYLILSDSNYHTIGYGFPEEMKYLEKYKLKNFIYLKMNNDTEKFINVFDLFIIMNDHNKLATIVSIKNFANIDEDKIIYCKFFRKNSLAPKQFQIYAKNPKLEFPINNETLDKSNNNKIDKKFSLQRILTPNIIMNMNTNNTNTINKLSCPSRGFNNIYDNNRQKGTSLLKLNTYDEEERTKNNEMDDLIALKDNNLTEHLACISEPFVELLEKTKGIFVYEANIIFVKDIHGNFLFKMCDNVICKSRLTPEEIEEEERIKNTMKHIHEKTIPKEIRKKVKNYEKVSKNAFCFGEFCKYQIPKYFKNMNKITKEEMIELNSKQSKIKERDKNHDFAFWIPYFLIKKSYDNQYLVNTLLKAYSIFPENFNKDQVLLDLQKAILLEDEKKEEENKREAERIKIEEKNKRLGIINNNDEDKFTILKKKTDLFDKNNFEDNFMNLDLNNTEENEELIKKEKEEEERDAIILYKPTPGKFAHFNFDKMYSKTHVCGNCNIIYMLIEDVFANFEDGENQSKYKILYYKLNF
jgi:hypothetical protein